jgi:serine/threonine protein kinase
MRLPLKFGNSDYKLLKCLGRGGEGIVYLVQEISSKQKYVVKVYYKPMERIWSEGLLTYEQKVNSPELGLTHITLLGNPDEIRAVKYPYTQLYQLHWRNFFYIENTAKALFRSFCRMQHYLMAKCGICLLDVITENFMLDKEGHFHFIDFGWLVRRIDHQPSIREGKFGYAVAMLLLDLYHENIKHTIDSMPNYPYNEPCVYFNITPMDELANSRAWVKDILEKVRSTNASSFLSPDFYLELSDGLPDLVAFPRFVQLSANSFRFVRDKSSIGNLFNRYK